MSADLLMRATWIACGALAVVVVVSIVASAAGRRWRRVHARSQHRLRLQYRDVLRDALTAPTDPMVPPVLQRAYWLPERRRILLDAACSLGGELPEADRARLGVVAELCGLRRMQERRLGAGHPLRRAAAAEAIGLLAFPGAAEGLFVAMRDPDQGVRLAAARSYHRLAGRRSAPALVRMLTTEPPEAQPALVELVTGLGSAAGREVLSALRDSPNAALVRLAVRCAATDDAVGALGEVLHVASLPATRLAAVRALGETASPWAVPALIEALDDPDTFVRSSAAASLARCGDGAAAAPLAALLDDPDHVVRSRAAAAIAALPDGRSVLAALSRSAVEAVRQAATVALQASLAQGGLTDLVSADDAVRDAAVRQVLTLLGEGRQRLLATVASRHHPDPRVRQRLAGLLAAVPPTDGDSPAPGAGRPTSEPDPDGDTGTGASGGPTSHSSWPTPTPAAAGGRPGPS